MVPAALLASHRSGLIASFVTRAGSGDRGAGSRDRRRGGAAVVVVAARRSPSRAIVAVRTMAATRTGLMDPRA